MTNEQEERTQKALSDAVLLTHTLLCQKNHEMTQDLECGFYLEEEQDGGEDMNAHRYWYDFVVKHMNMCNLNAEQYVDCMKHVIAAMGPIDKAKKVFGFFTMLEVALDTLFPNWDEGDKEF